MRMAEGRKLNIVSCYGWGRNNEQSNTNCLMGVGRAERNPKLWWAIFKATRRTDMMVHDTYLFAFETANGYLSVSWEASDEKIISFLSGATKPQPDPPNNRRHCYSPDGGDCPPTNGNWFLGD